MTKDVRIPKKLTRSEQMSRVRGRDTKPEILLRKALWERGFRYRLCQSLPGRPDLVFSKARLAVFVDGCFWHGCPLHYSAPAENEEFWKKKLRDNVLRDIAVDDELISQNWKVLRIWQHDLKNIEEVIRKISELSDVRTKPYETAPAQVTNVAESVSRYGGSPYSAQPNFGMTCRCESRDVRVISVSRPGSLRPNSRNKPDSIELICRKCREVFHLSLTAPL